MSAFVQMCVRPLDGVAVAVDVVEGGFVGGGGFEVGFEVGGFADGGFVFDEDSDVVAGVDLAFVGDVVDVAEGLSDIFINFPGVQVLLWSVKGFDGLQS